MFISMDLVCLLVWMEGRYLSFVNSARNNTLRFKWSSFNKICFKVTQYFLHPH